MARVFQFYGDAVEIYAVDQPWHSSLVRGGGARVQLGHRKFYRFYADEHPSVFLRIRERKASSAAMSLDGPDEGRPIPLDWVPGTLQVPHTGDYSLLPVHTWCDRDLQRLADDAVDTVLDNAWFIGFGGNLVAGYGSVTTTSRP